MRKKRIIALLALAGIVAVVLAAPWRTSALGWHPPRPWRCELEGTWVGDSTIHDNTFAITFSPAGAANRYLGFTIDAVNFDPRVDTPLGWAFPDVSALQNMAFPGNLVRTGPRTFDYSAIWYATDENRQLVCIWAVYDGKAESMDANTYEDSHTWLIFSAREQVSPVFGLLLDQDADDDGLPDPGEIPVLSIPDAHIVKRLMP
jgi:hypothetical protein